MCKFRILFLFSLSVLAICSGCIFKNDDIQVDLTRLSTAPSWNCTNRIKEASFEMYYFSLCQPLNFSSDPLLKNCTGSYICKKFGSEVAPLITNVTKHQVIGKIPNLHLYIMEGDKTVIITFKCGNSLGSPHFLIKFQDESHYFSWETSVVCPTSAMPNRSEVPCYAIDSEGYKRDLSPLILPTGGYRVLSTSFPLETQFYINVCADLVSSNESSNCDKGNAACLILTNLKTNSTGVGKVTSPPRLVDRSTIELVYETSPDIPYLCSEPVKTTIEFFCPLRYEWDHPRLVSGMHTCNYKVRWPTEYACPSKVLRAKRFDCRLTAAQHGVDLDLNPLHKPDGPYKFKGILNNKTVEFLLNVCNEKKIISIMSPCRAGICMKSPDTPYLSIGVGERSLRFVEGTLDLEFESTMPCPGGKTVTSHIEFLCDKDAGNGMPQFVHNDSCTFYFIWQTHHACPPKMHQCLFTQGTLHFDLSELGTSGKPFPVMAGSHSQENEDIYINPCYPIYPSSNTPKPCPAGTSFCLFRESTPLNIGDISWPPTYNETTKEIAIRFEGGNACNNGSSQGLLIMSCHPGDLTGAPHLSHRSSDGCYYEITWETSFSCPSKLYTGSDCRVSNDILGVTFDLNELAANNYYTVSSSSNATYLINICQPVQQSPCNIHGNETIGICKLENSEKGHIHALVNTTLTYQEGIVRLEYYNNDKKLAASISLICSSGAGKGSPRWIAETSDGIEIFEWYTSLSCSSPFTQECVVKDNMSGETYDISSLSNITFTTNGPKNTKYYLKICHPLTNIKQCDRKASVCRVKYNSEGIESEDLPNLGQYFGDVSLVVHSPGHLMLTYSSGHICDARSPPVNATSTIHFICPPTEIYNGKVQYLKVPDPCYHSFILITKAACPTSYHKEKSGQCLAKRPSSDEIVDLSALSRPQGYQVKLNDGPTIWMNLCSPLEEVCKNCNASIFLPPNQTLAYFKDSYISQYGFEISFNFIGQDPHDASKKEYEVNLVCPEKHNYSREIAHLFTRHDSLYILKLETPLACPPAEPKCIFSTPQGAQYDLSPLIQHNGDGIFTAYSTQNVTLKMSFCKTLPTTLCGGSSFICLKYLQDAGSKWIGLGSPHHPPTVREDGVIVMNYIGGDPCPKGNQSSSATVNFICSGKHTSPLYLGASFKSCTFIFYMETPYACPLKDAKGEGNCTIEDPITKKMLDLSSLNLTTSSYNISFGERNSTILLNVCGKLSGDAIPTSCQGASVCEVPTDKSLSPLANPILGFPNATLTLEGGFIKLTYESHKNCQINSSQKFVTSIWFLCDYEHNSKLSLLDKSECELHLLWHTHLACTQEVETECSVLDEKTGKYYDLTPLKLSSNRHFVTTAGDLVEISVCKGLDYSLTDTRRFKVSYEKTACTHDAGACLISPALSTNSKVLHLGKVAAPKIVDDELTLIYEGGSPCPSDHSKNISTSIKFFCDDRRGENLFEGDLEISEIENCEYHFIWEAPAACPIDQHHTQSGSCSVLNPLTGYQFNFSMLFEQVQNKSVIIEQGFAHSSAINGSYLFAACENSSNLHCGPGVGICQMRNGTVTSILGTLANSTFEYRAGVLLLTYGPGDYCGTGNKTTQILFICSIEETSPYISSSSPCSTTVTWHTMLACESKVQCNYIQNGTLFDVNNVMETSQDYVHLMVGEDILYLSICGPLPSRLGCPANAAACLFKGVEPLNLGKAERDLFLNFAEEPTLIYSQGSPCSDNPDGLGYRTKVTFACDPQAGRGNPLFVKYSQCIYEFLWYSSVICNEQDSFDYFNKSECIYTDAKTQAKFDLSPLKWNGPYEIKEANYTISPCNTLQTENCTKASICHRGSQGLESFGDFSKSTFRYKGRHLYLYLNTSIPCIFSANGKKGSTIEFLCDNKAGLGVPKLLKSSLCHAYFHWPTELVCREKPPVCKFTANGWQYDFMPLSSYSHDWNVTDEHNNLYWLNLCRRLNAVNCHPDSVACMKKDGEKMKVSIGLHQYQDISIDYEGNIVMTFHRGHTCANTSASTEITFICGSGTKSPLFILFNSQSCTYKFKWETHYACKSQDVYLQEAHGLVYDVRIQKAFNITQLLENSFAVSADHHLRDDYVFLINLQSGVGSSKDTMNVCLHAAVCQTKPGSHFYRDIGTYFTRQFVVHSNGSVNLELTSHGRPCGKNPKKNVTTIIRLACSEAAKLGTPKFIYETGDCDYIFEWDTDVLCHKHSINLTEESWEMFNKTGKLESNEADNPSTIDIHANTPAANPLPIIIGLVAAFLLLLPILYIISSPERRSSTHRWLRSIFTTHRMPKFLYRKINGHTYLISPGDNSNYCDDSEDDDGNLIS